MYNKKIVNGPRITFLSHDFCSPVPVFLKDATGHWSGPSITTRDSSRPAIAASATNDGPPSATLPPPQKVGTCSTSAAVSQFCLSVPNASYKAISKRCHASHTTDNDKSFQNQKVEI